MTRELQQLCDQVEQLAEKIRNDVDQRPHNIVAKQVARYMFAKAYKSYQAAILLYQSGFWQDAASIARTLLELSFQVRLFKKDPDNAAKLFARGEEHERIKVLKTLVSFGDEDTKDSADAVLKEALSSMGLDDAWHHWWADESNIKKLAGEIGSALAYEFQYRPLSWFVHSSPITIRYFFEERGDGWVFDFDPSPPPAKTEGFAETLFSAAPSALVDVLAAVDSIYDLKLQKDFDRLRDAFDAFLTAHLTPE